MMAFDMAGAKKAGYSDQEIADYLASQSKFDVAGARKAGYSDQEIIGHLTAAEEPSLLQKGSHLAAVTNRAILKGLADLPGAALDVVAYPFRKGTEALTGETIPTYGQLIDSGLDQLTTATGVGADPQTSGERILASTARGATGALSGVGVGQQLVRSAGPTTAAVGEFLAQNPIVQSISGAGAGASGQTAQEMGAGPGGQLAASLAGGLVTGLAAAPFAAAPIPTGLPPGARTGPPPPAGPNGVPGTEYQNAVAALEHEGIPLTTGQRMGTNWVKATERGLAEVPLGGRPIQNAFEDQARAYQAALLRQTGLDTGDNMITREVLERARAGIGQRYTGALRGQTLNLSENEFINDLADIEYRHAQMLPFEQRQQVRQIIDDSIDRAAQLQQSGQALTGEEYQRLRSTLGQRAAGTQNTYIAGLYRDLRHAYDDLFARTVGPEKFQIDQQYARLRQLQTIFERSGGPAASEGYISPIAVAREAAGAPGGVDWQDFTRAAATVLPDRIGNSGTAQRNLVLNALAGGGALVQPIPTAVSLGATNLLARQLANGTALPNPQALAEALRRAGYPASIATLQQQ